MNSAQALSHNLVTAGYLVPTSRPGRRTRPERRRRDRGVDRPDIALEFIAVLAGGQPKRVTDQIDDADSRCQPCPAVRPMMRRRSPALEALVRGRVERPGLSRRGPGLGDSRRTGLAGGGQLRSRGELASSRVIKGPVDPAAP
jgi:hypothetical protein